LKEEVRVEAIRNAQQSARTLAEALGQKIGKCFYIWDSNSDIMPAYYNNAVSVRSAKGISFADFAEEVEEEPLDFKTIRLQYSVQTKFVLE
ncbi:MAG: SIMPL domain-containing protein, partial [Alistipes sp.]|nr:SIMPL domain-containing protein [Alistipes sp.]